ncbi:Proteasome subunit beta type-6 [Armadillidium nasatum]|uniref:Proteasome subunit beta n=1 Tax=Armadillidium nasatum TaxID=96803 RepID=A0A5N5SX03_9CRUS|nr:Proteasome subunit beta type-6 [Armadillidium nasatum]
MESFICKPKYVEGVDKSHLKQLIPEQLQDEPMTGTTIMAIEFDGGVVIGADSRTSMGAYCSNRYADKLTPVTDKIFCCRSGSSADTQAVADIVASYMEILEIKMGEPVAVQIAANTFKEICYNYRDRLTAGIIVAGWDKMKKGQVYIIPLGGMMLRQPVAIGGSGSTFIWGYVDANYKEGMTKDEAVEFVKNAVTLALTRDNSSSGVVRVGIITKDGVERKVFTHDKLPKFQ